jgi:hypothetical protein
MPALQSIAGASNCRIPKPLAVHEDALTAHGACATRHCAFATSISGLLAMAAAAS